jgi:hypothetical protein
MPLVSSCRRVSLVMAATVVATGSTAAPALAGGAAPTCPVAAVTNPFAPWGDHEDYSLAPDGDVESAAASWSVTGGAGAAEGNETFMVTRPKDHRSMRLPGSSSATTARMCLGVEHPTFRFFAKRLGGSILSRLLVEVVYDDVTGREQSLPVGLVAASEAWAPSSQLPTAVGVLAAVHGTAGGVSFRFRPVAGGTWSVDDVYVDPRRIG